MKKIKPEVIGVRKVYRDGGFGFITWKLGKIPFLASKAQRGIHAHKNGKPKFRLVYKNTKLPTSK